MGGDPPPVLARAAVFGDNDVPLSAHLTRAHHVHTISLRPCLITYDIMLV